MLAMTPSRNSRPVTFDRALLVFLAATTLLTVLLALGTKPDWAHAALPVECNLRIDDGCEPPIDEDADDDGVLDSEDNCMFVKNPGQADWNNDGQGDACDDSDGDGVKDSTDNCRQVANADQGDQDADGVGNACDPDWSGEPTAAIDWTMPKRARDTNGDGLLDMEVVPPLGWAPATYEVTLDGCDSTQGQTAIAAYVWEIPQNSTPIETTNCQHTLRLAEGSYPTELTVRTAGGQTNTTTRTVVVRDRLMVVMGDSYASGEGNPERNIVWGDGVVAQQPVWADRRCHRSGHAATARAALTLENEDPRSSVTYLSKACSGGTITNGILGPYKGVDPEDPNNPVPPQIDTVKAAVGQAKIDDLLISVGGNDIGFGDIAQSCLIGTFGYQCHKDANVTNGFTQKLGQLPSAYTNLRLRIENELQAAQVYVGEYPDFTKNEVGGQCWAVGQDIGHLMWIDSEEGHWASSTVLGQLNSTLAAQVAAANSAPGGGRWQFVDGINALWAGSTYGHGYCIGEAGTPTTERWVRTFTESCDMQGPPSGWFFGAYACMANGTKGLLHPNARGQNAAASRHLLHLRANVPTVDAVPPGEPGPGDGGGGGTGGGGGGGTGGGDTGGGGTGGGDTGGGGGGTGGTDGTQQPQTNTTTQQTTGGGTTSTAGGGGSGQSLTQAADGAGAPSWLVGGGKAQRALKARALRFTVTPSEACTLSATAKLGKAVLGRLKKSVPATPTTLKLKLTKKGRRALGKALRRKKTLSVVLGTRCVDASGDAAIQVDKLKVRR